MIITAMRNWKPEPGILMEWHPTSSSARAISATSLIDEVPPTFLQQTHVQGFRAKQQRGGPHRAFLGVASEVDGDLDVSALTRALRRFVQRHDGLQTYFDTDTGVARRHKIDSAAIDFEAVDAGSFVDVVDFESYIIKRFEVEATPVSWPVFAFGAVMRPAGFTLYYACDHAFTDGASQVLALSELVDLYQVEATDTKPSPYTTADTDGFRSYSRIEQHRTHAHTPDTPEVREWLEVFAANGSKMPTFPLDLGLETGQTAPVRPVEFDLLDAPSTETFDAICKRSGGKLVSGIYAAVAIADYELAGKADFYGMSVLSSRDLGNFQLSQGWICNFAPVAFHSAAAATFTELVQTAHAGHLRAKRLAAAPVQSVILALLATGAKSSDVTASPNMISYIDFRRFPGVETLPYERAIEFTGEGETANASMWFNRDRHHLYLGSQTPDTPQAREHLSTYHDHLLRIFTTVAQEGEYRLNRTRHHAKDVTNVSPSGTPQYEARIR